MSIGVCMNYAAWSTQELKAAAVSVNTGPLRTLASLLGQAETAARTFADASRTAADDLAAGWKGTAADAATKSVTKVASSADPTAANIAAARTKISSFADKLDAAVSKAQSMPVIASPDWVDYVLPGIMAPASTVAKFIADQQAADAARQALLDHVQGMDSAGFNMGRSMTSIIPVDAPVGTQDPLPLNPPPAATGGGASSPGRYVSSPTARGGGASSGGSDGGSSAGGGTTTTKTGGGSGGGSGGGTTTGPTIHPPLPRPPQPPIVDPSVPPDVTVVPPPTVDPTAAEPPIVTPPSVTGGVGSGGTTATPGSTPGSAAVSGAFPAVVAGGTAAVGLGAAGAASATSSGAGGAGLGRGAATGPGMGRAGMTSGEGSLTRGVSSGQPGTNAMGRPAASTASSRGTSGNTLSRSVGRGGMEGGTAQRATGQGAARRGVLGEQSASRLASRSPGSTGRAGAQLQQSSLGKGRGARDRDDEQGLRQRPEYLVASDEVWGDGRDVVNGVLGQVEENHDATE